MSSRQKVEASLRQLERDRALLQHQSAENLRKVEIETERKRGLENEREHLSKWLPSHSGHINSQITSKMHLQQISLPDEAMKGNLCFPFLKSEQPEGSAGGSSEKEPGLPNVK